MKEKREGYSQFIPHFSGADPDGHHFKVDYVFPARAGLTRRREFYGNILLFKSFQSGL